MAHGQSDTNRFNGKTGGEWARWIGSILLAAIVAYFTAQAKSEAQYAELRERQINNFNEVLRRLDLLQADVRELRSR